MSGTIAWMCASPCALTAAGMYVRASPFGRVLAGDGTEEKEVDPERADALAKADQRARIAAFGGREAILGRGSFGYSPAPGTKPVYN